MFEPRDNFMIRSAGTQTSTQGIVVFPSGYDVSVDVIPAPQSFVVTGGLGEVVKPDLCANCGCPTSERLLVEKVFERRDSDSPTAYSIARVNVPFCPTCIRRHREEVKPVTPLARLLLCFRSGTGVGGAFSAAFGLWLFPKFLPRMLRGDLTNLLVFSAIPGLFFLIAYGCFRAAWDETEHLAVIPATSITSAFDYSDNCAQTFDVERRIYTLRNERFAQAMLEANRDRVWNPNSRGARTASRKRNVLFIVMTIAFGSFILWEILKDLFG